MTAPTGNEHKIRAVLIDLSGTLHIGDEEIQGAREALGRLRSAEVVRRRNDGIGEGLAIRFLTNTSTKSVSELLAQLNNASTLDFGISPNEMITSVRATVDYVKDKRLNPLLLMEDPSDFVTREPGNNNNDDDVNKETPTRSTATLPNAREPDYDSVVVGLAPSQFHYERLNLAFRVLLEHPEHLIAVHRGNYFRDSVDRELSLGPGAFVAALETASNCAPAKVMGKPSKAIFDSALQSINSEHQTPSNETPTDTDTDTDTGQDTTTTTTTSDTNFQTISMDEVCMIGDDVLVDCWGALTAGIGTAILVQTGKYRAGDEEKLTANTIEQQQQQQQQQFSGAFLVCPSIVEAADLILKSL